MKNKKQKESIAEISIKIERKSKLNYKNELLLV